MRGVAKSLHASEGTTLGKYRVVRLSAAPPQGCRLFIFVMKRKGGLVFAMKRFQGILFGKLSSTEAERETKRRSGNDAALASDSSSATSQVPSGVLAQ